MTNRSDVARQLLITKRQKAEQAAFLSGAATAIRFISTGYNLDAEELRQHFAKSISKEIGSPHSVN